MMKLIHTYIAAYLRTYIHTYVNRVSDHIYTLFISETEYFRKNVSDNSCGVLNDPFSDLISLTIGVTKIRAMSL